jgi:GDP-L-fucose synthase
MHQPKRILVTGGGGFLGSHVCDALRARWETDVELVIPQRPGDDLRDMATCERLVADIDTVIHLAARVGGIGFNQTNSGALFYDNAVMGIQLMEAARRAGVQKFVAIGTVCAYPKFTPVPFKEDDLWIGYPEETNAPYGLAKKMLLVQAQAYRAQYGFNAIYLLPVNLYGPGDDFDPLSSHVIPALIRKMVEARDSGAPSVEVWGTGTATREFCFSRDTAQGIVLATERYDSQEPVNLGSGMEISIHGLSGLIKRLVGYHGEIAWNASKPDGQPRRCLDVTRAEREFGFRAQISFEDGLKETIAWFEEAKKNGTV